MSGVVRSVGNRVARVGNRIAGVVDSIAGRIQSGVGIGRRIVGSSVHIGDSGILNVGFSGIVVSGGGLARGKAEREDRNGHSSLNHDRSTPYVASLGDADLGLSHESIRPAPGNSDNPYPCTRDYSHDWN
ncbi:MAG TPA: hypothetical protein VK955_14460 [Xanthobacteraceae bacterium]|nr:hypothetical protein [Xanthobacteraceae bacterium]